MSLVAETTIHHVKGITINYCTGSNRRVNWIDIKVKTEQGEVEIALFPEDEQALRDLRTALHV